MMQQKNTELSRRSFLGRAGAVVAGFTALNAGALTLAGCSGASPLDVSTQTDAAAKSLSWQTVITSKDEPGRPLVVSGRIYSPDGKTPLEGITLYVYHTDHRGLYTENDRGGGDASVSARLRGWMKTDREGRYEFRTIKPASYPNSSNPEHVHTKANGPGYPERWLDNFWFADDPLIAKDMHAKYGSLGSFSPIMAVRRGTDGLLHCVRDIRLERA